jgi:two-component system cell cycle response regulator DivK
VAPATILVVEDNPANRELLVELLESEGYRVCQAADAHAAIAMAGADPPQLILMDLQLPGLDGLEATRRLKADDATQAIPVVAVTAHAHRGEALARAAGCEAYLSKPIRRQELLDVVARCLGEAAAGDP